MSSEHSDQGEETEPSKDVEEGSCGFSRHSNLDEDEFLEEHSDSDDGGWPDKDTGWLIELYRSKPQLYDVSHKYYSNRDRKTATLTYMAQEMQCSGEWYGHQYTCYF